MNDWDEFVEVALGIFVALTLLLWFLTRLERTLHDPAPQHRNQRRTQPPAQTPTDEPPADLH